MARTRATEVSETALASLASYFGIEPAFRNAHGESIVTRVDTQRHLLAAMGVDATTDQKAAAALAAARSAEARAVMPPVLVVRSVDGRCPIEIAVPPEAPSVAWRIALEDGTERAGSVNLGSKPPKGARGAVNRVRIDLGDLPWGHHRLLLSEHEATAELIVTPEACWLPESFINGAGAWGISAQLYSLRSEQNWGIGDFADLRKLIEITAPRGCQIIGLNPLHQMFLDSPEEASPYSPLTRLYLNVLYIAVPEVPGFGISASFRALFDSAEFQSKLAQCRGAPNVDYSGVLALKLDALRVLYSDFSQGTSDKPRFEAFRSAGGLGLLRAATFQALRDHFAAESPGLTDWHKWPEPYRNPASPEVERFIAIHGGEIDFLIWLQWIADNQLAAAARTAEDAGMAIGLYRDLAVGCDQSGAETWANPGVFLSGAKVGAPPDIFNPGGQNWGLPPFHPKALKEEAYRSFAELIRANMRYAGGLRIDHVMGLQHLYCVPEGSSAANGAYVGYPLDDLIGILALESHRHRCLVVGEDLGTVPEGFREKMAASNILSYRVLFFEQVWDGGQFVPPRDYPRLALAVAGSHDLPTLLGWWEGGDITLKERLGLLSTGGEASSQRRRREQERTSIMEAFRREGILHGEGQVAPEAFVQAAHRYLAGSAAALVVPQLDDLLGELIQVNVPGTSAQHPNWRRKYRMTLEEINVDQTIWGRVASLSESRPQERTRGK